MAKWREQQTGASPVCAPPAVARLPAAAILDLKRRFVALQGALGPPPAPDVLPMPREAEAVLDAEEQLPRDHPATGVLREDG
eukprot:268871-Alexandrium_andersonii.AAC.1